VAHTTSRSYVGARKPRAPGDLRLAQLRTVRAECADDCQAPRQRLDEVGTFLDGGIDGLKQWCGI